MEKKYRLTEETKELYGSTLHRIEALKDFGNVKKGEKGGWIEGEYNLSHYDNCWVSGEAILCENAFVSGDVLVCGDAVVFGSAQVFGSATVSDHAEVYGNAWLCDNVKVCDHAVVCERARVYGNAYICGNAVLRDKAVVCGDAVIKDESDYLVFKNTWSSGRYFTWTRSNNMWIVGCFYGTGDELIKKAYADSERSGDCYKLTVEYVNKLNEKLNLC